MEKINKNPIDVNEWEKMDYSERAEALFLKGYNCSQSVFLSFVADKMDFDEAAKLASAFGGGLAGMRTVCGTISGAALAYGYLHGYCNPKAIDEKQKEYEIVHKIAEEFERENGSIICRELLGLDKKTKYVSPSDRSGDYYKKRPCSKLCAYTAGFLERYLKENE